MPGRAFGELVALADFLGGTFGEDFGGSGKRGGEQGGGLVEGALGGGGREKMEDGLGDERGKMR